MSARSSRVVETAFDVANPLPDDELDSRTVIGGDCRSPDGVVDSAARVVAAVISSNKKRAVCNTNLGWGICMLFAPYGE